jgi:antitoxin (DNA-binding transcriptional repressor) of toxin-antitoxin stability system
VNHEITLEEAACKLVGLVESLKPGDEIILTVGERPVAKIVSVPRGERRLGMLQGTVTYMAPDFDAPLDDFKESME